MESSTKPAISQKEYLKKYFSKKEKPRKKKKVNLSSSKHLKRSTIIDEEDDLNLNAIASVDDDVFNLEYLGDEAPSIAGIIDERPDHVKAAEEYGNQKVWKPIGDKTNDLHTIGTDDLWGVKASKEHQGGKIRSVSEIVSLESKRISKVSQDYKTAKTDINLKDCPDERTHSFQSKRDSSYDLSPPREGRNIVDSPKQKNSYPLKTVEQCRRENDISSPLVKRKYSTRDLVSPEIGNDSRNLLSYQKHNSGSDNDLSPPRKSKNHDFSHPKKQRGKAGKHLSPTRSSTSEKEQRGSDNDLSLPRKNKRDGFSPSGEDIQNRDKDLCPPRKSHFSSYRKHKRRSDDDLSPPPRKETNKKYHSPPRKQRKDISRDLSSDRNMDRNKRSSHYNGKTNITVDDNKKRHHSKNNDNSFLKKHHKENKDLSPLRQNKKLDMGSSSPRRQYEEYKSAQRNLSPPRQNSRNKSGRNDGDITKSKDSTLYKSDDDLSPPRSRPQVSKEDKKRLEKTLDGKKAGLQDAASLRDELRDLRQKEASMFKTMGHGSLNQGSVIVRDRKTGKIKDLEKEKEDNQKKNQKNKELEAKYAKWSKGLAQVEAAESRVKETLHEMSKPLARYKDDSDLDKFLRDQEREGDPMLEYIKSKQKEAHTVENSKKVYQGSYPLNRFNIRPGHRWDGVVRSNGYEERWFEQINSRKALQEEAYKWSSEDL